MSKISSIEKIIKEIQELEFVEDAFLDEDCAPEGDLSIHIMINEDNVNEICEELGYNVDNWEEEDE